MNNKLPIEITMDTICTNMMFCYKDNPGYVIMVFTEYLKTGNENLFTRQNSIRNSVQSLGLETIKKEIIKLPVKWMAYLNGAGKATRLHGNLDKMEFGSLSNPSTLSSDQFLDTTYCFLKSQQGIIIQTVMDENAMFSSRLVQEYFDLRYKKTNNNIDADVLDSYYQRNYESQQIMTKIDLLYENKINQSINYNR